MFTNLKLDSKQRILSLTFKGKIQDLHFEGYIGISRTIALLIPYELGQEIGNHKSRKPYRLLIETILKEFEEELGTTRIETRTLDNPNKKQESPF